VQPFCHTAHFTVHESPDALHDAVVDPRAWWHAGIAGPTCREGDEFTHVARDHRARLRVATAVTGHRVVWHVVESAMPHLLEDPGEWVDTDVVFEIETTPLGTRLRFTHDGLVPALACYADSRSAWVTALASLHALVTTGTGHPQRDAAVDATRGAAPAGRA